MKSLEISSEVIISPRGARRLQQGHLWIYASDIVAESEGIVSPIVRVLDGARNTVGFAFYSINSQIRLRLLSKEPDPPDIEFLRRRIEASIGRRRNQAAGGSAGRLIYGEADLLPSIIVDRYSDYLVLQTLSRGADALKGQITEILKELLEPAGILERNDVKARTLEGLEEKRGVLCGSIPERVEIAEADLRFLVDLLGGQKTGFFLDQKENRIAAGRYASGKALDCFTNSGAFALHFAKRCEHVQAIDISAASLLQARQNAEYNGITNITLDEGNVFDRLRELERAGEEFDTICLDPPAFAKNRNALRSAIGGYKEINLRAIKCLKPGGVLITSSCSYHLSEPAFIELLHEAACDAHRYLQILERRSQSSDHPILSGMPETFYLKCLIIRVL